MKNSHAQNQALNVLRKVIRKLTRGGKQIILELWSILYPIPYLSPPVAPEGHLLSRLKDCAQSLVVICKGGLCSLISNVLTILNSCFYFIVHSVFTTLTIPAFILGALLLAIVNLVYFVTHSIIIHLFVHSLTCNIILIILFAPFALIDDRSCKNTKKHLRGLYQGLCSTKNIFMALITSIYELLVNKEHFAFSAESRDESYYAEILELKETQDNSSYTQIHSFAEKCHSCFHDEGLASWNYLCQIFMSSLAASIELVCVATYSTAVITKAASSFVVCPVAIVQHIMGAENAEANMVPEIQKTWNN